MKNSLTKISTASVVLVLLLILNTQLSVAHAQGTAFTYQGRMDDSALPANGTYDMRFAVFNASAGGNQAGNSVTNFATAVSNGLFTVTVNFGGIFTGTNYWLDIGVRTNGASSFAALTPRQPLTPTPYAIFANSASNLLGTLQTATNFTGNLNGDVTGTQSATVVSLVGGQTAANVASGASAANAATDADFPNTIVKRDANGDFVTESVALDNTELRGSGIGAYYARDYLLRADNSKGNFYIGDNPPRATFANGFGNTGVGTGAAFNDTSGSYNTAVGSGALPNSTNANYNTAVGAYALQVNVIGNNNTANGYQALNSDMSDDNVADGFQALFSNVSGFANTAIGFQALYSNNGVFNTATGAGALQLNSSGSDNVADGYEALFFNTASDNTASGFGAMYYNTTGFNDVANGYEALYENTTGGNNTADGFDALYFNTNGNNNVANGFDALFSNRSGNNNVAIGAAALSSNTTGSNNVANGFAALSSNTNGNFNTANGFEALHLNQSGNFNTANGFEALCTNTASFNTADGFQALCANTSGADNVANGFQALFANIDGGANTAIGEGALSANTNGSENVAIGISALTHNTSGFDNVAVGPSAGENITTGGNNIAIGNQAGSGITTGNGNIDIGATGLAADTNITRIGGGALGAKTFIAGIFNATASGGIAVFINSAGQLGTVTSSARFKRNIHSMASASDALLSLRPVTFQYKPDIDPKGIPQFGLVAEEVAKVDPDLVLRDDQGRPYTVRYEAVNAMLLNEFLKEHQKVENQNTQILDLKYQNEMLEKRLDNLTMVVKCLSKNK